ncbi:hypothetical protein M0R72_04075 [Candidatus Pacearchaeota archaeon]|jgi:hypothetical protein|nr:hypothetical protein [Candidatus Pacearchaeota archaeon]
MKKEDKKNSEEDESKLEQEIEELEEEISDEDEIFDEEIVQFIPSVKSKSTTLDKINISEDIPLDLEENLRKTTHLPDDEDDSFRYGNQKGESKESEYQNFNPNYSAEMITSIDGISKGRNNFRNVAFAESAEARISPEKNFERYEQVKRFDKDDFRKTDLERREVKYKPLN